MEILITIFAIGLALGYFILHPFKSIKFMLLTIGVFILGLIGFSILVGIPMFLLAAL